MCGLLFSTLVYSINTADFSAVSDHSGKLTSLPPAPHPKRSSSALGQSGPFQLPPGLSPPVGDHESRQPSTSHRQQRGWAQLQPAFRLITRDGAVSSFFRGLAHRCGDTRTRKSNGACLPDYRAEAGKEGRAAPGRAPPPPDALSHVARPSRRSPAPRRPHNGTLGGAAVPKALPARPPGQSRSSRTA